MSRIFPFRAFRYQLPDTKLKQSVCPPYDIIGESLEKKLRKSNVNAIQIELPSGSPEEKYRNAEEIWDQWRVDGIVGQDSKPAFYIYEQIFKAEGKKYSRRGFFCALQVEKPGEGSVLRHELTLSGPKQDRLKLLRSLQVNTSPIFGLFQDRKRQVTRLIDRYAHQKPVAAFTDPDGVTHKLWICSDSKEIELIQNTVAKTPVAIADGHHRYETSWNYFVEQNDQGHVDDGNGSGPSSTFFFLCPMESKGLVIFPTHRIFREKFRLKDLVSRVQSRADIFETRPIRSIPKHPAPSTFILTDGKESWLTRIKSIPNLKKTLPGKPDSLLKLSLVHVHSVLFPEMKKEDFIYVHDQREALKFAKRNRTAAILFPATSTRELYAIVKAGELMPQKSTYFYPKIITGLVFRSL